MKTIHLNAKCLASGDNFKFFGCLEVLPEDVGGGDSSDRVSTPRYRVAHFEADFGVTVTENDQVTSWLSRPDVFGNTINQLRANGPELVEESNLFYNKDVVRFSANNDFLTNSNFSRLTQTDSFTRVMVVKSK